MAADGMWNLTLQSPMGAQEVTFDAKTDGSALTGTFGGGQLPSQEISDGQADGDNLTWKVAMTQPMAMTLEFSAAIDGDAMTGEAKLGTFGTAPFSGSRAG